MKVAENDLAVGQNLETKAKKQQSLVGQKKITMRAQLEKIDYLKAQVKKHKEAGEEAAVAAREALDKAKKAIHSQHEAVARERYANVVDVPIGKKALKKAAVAVKRDQDFENSERDEIHTLDKDHQYQLNRIRKIQREQRENESQLNIKLQRARFAKDKLTKAESVRDATLTNNAAAMKAIKARLDAAEASFAKAAEDAKKAASAPKEAPKESTEVTELGEDLVNADTDPDMPN